MDEEDLVDIKIPTPPDEDDSDDEKDLKDSLLEGKRIKRDSIPGIKPSPMPGVSLFSRFVTFW